MAFKPSKMRNCAAFAWVLGIIACSVGQRTCPELRSSTAKSKRSQRANVTIYNLVNATVDLQWIDTTGKEQSTLLIEPGAAVKQKSYIGDVFRMYAASSDESRTLLLEHSVRHNKSTVLATPCDGKFESALKSKRADEFMDLAKDLDEPCEPADDSSKWSCVRVLDREEVAQRDPNMYGIPEGHAAAGVKSGDVLDTTHVRQMKFIPKVTAEGPGFLIVKFTPRMNEVRQWWLDYSAKHGFGERETLRGGFDNSVAVEKHIMRLGRVNPKMRSVLMKEVQQILEWWTGLPMEHTSTYGVRTYRRGNVLIDHVDKKETHIASAVLQFSQGTDVNAGWPLEVLLPNGRVGEVYLQPGEMVLYEGAWLMHGRPQVFRGDNFSNVFCHFRPRDWISTSHLAGNRYYGVPDGRLTTLVHEGIRSSNQYGRLLRQREDL
eukprot:TRINITY_DN1999_c0_g2_i2.p1 TRINITY_DN1999_c0_g2~~TRINITY_DN1999_c0_g2_i2.p1  ORF type:complete len:433 (+),score=43.87 TRINITY_DN1999_c0_g2_i2:68-1366(+)